MRAVWDRNRDGICLPVRRRNILDTQNSTYLKSCRYDSRSDVDRLCPIFVLGDIVRETQASPNDTYANIALLVRNACFPPSRNVM